MSGIKKAERIRKILLAGWHPYAIIFAVGFVLYFKTVFFDYTYLDDNALILNDYQFLSDFANIGKSFLRDAFGTSGNVAQTYYRPLQTVLFIAAAHISGTKLYAFHLVNISVHSVSAILLFIFLARLNYRRSLAFFFSILFVTHPVLTQAVAWVPGLNDSLLTLFTLGFLITLVDLTGKKPNENEELPFEGQETKYLGHLVLFALALFSKESALLLPSIAFLYIYLIKQERKFLLNYQILSIGYLATTLFWFFLRRAALTNPLPLQPIDLSKSFLANSPVMIQYVGKTLFPFNLSVLSTISDTTFVYGAAALILIIISIVLSKQKRGSYLIFGSAWFLLFIAPTLIFHNPGLKFGYDYHLEHRMHLAIIGLFIIFLEIDQIKNLRFSKLTSLITAEVLVILFITLTLLHSDHFKNKLSFWQNAAKSAPHSPLAERNLGAMYYLDNRPDEAEPYYRKALELNPNEEMAHNNLGLIYAFRNQDDLAESEYKKEIEINPDYAAAYFNLGLLYYKQKKVRQAEEFWQKTLLVNPQYLGAYQNLAVLYLDQKDIGKLNEIISKMRAFGLPIQLELQQLISN